MRLTSLIQQINNQALDTLKRSISKTILEATPYLQAVKENQVKILSQKLSNINNWYIKVTGLDKVYLAQEKVNRLQEQLLNIQEKRRDVGRQLSEIRSKSMEYQDEIHKTKRNDDLEKFLDLMKKETEVLKLEKSITTTFQDYDRAERELFTAFTDSIRDSHEKQRAQMEYTKYFGIVLSIAGSFLAFVYSTLKKEQMKQIIDERLKTLEFPNNSVEFNKLISKHNEINRNVIQTQGALDAALLKIAKGNVNEHNIPSSGKNNLDKFDVVVKDLKLIHYVGIIIGIWFVAKIFSN